MTNPEDRKRNAEQGGGLARQLGLFGTTMAVMGGIIGSGIFINPYLVADRVHTSALILGAWAAGGIIALLGGFIYAELAARLPVVGGQYAYLREALHPGVAFLYGWVLLLVIQTGGMAAVAVTFARYFLELTGWRLNASILAASALALLTAINCLGVRVGSRVQSTMTLTAIGAIGVLELASFIFGGPSQISWRPALGQPVSATLLFAFGSAMTPVLFAYGGWQTSSFLGGEVRDPKKTLPRGLVLGVLGVIAVYTSVNFVYVRVLGSAGLAATMTPASTVMTTLLGPRGGSLIAAGIAFSAFGFLGQSMLTAPRVYFAMAQDQVFFRAVAWIDPRTSVPVVAIVLQGLWAIVIALTGTYAQVVNYVVAMDSIFFGLTAVCLFVMRKRAALKGLSHREYRVPGHPWTTLLFISAEWMVVASTFEHDPKRSLIGLTIALAGLPAYYLWSVKNKREGSGMMGPARTKRSLYMEWAKTRSHAKFNLATSGLMSVQISEFPVRLDDLEITAPGAYGYTLLQQRLAKHNGVPEECVVAATGTSMANHIAMAAVLDPGDEVLIEQPVYGPLLDVAEYLGARVLRIPRRAEKEFAVDPADVAQLISRETRLIVLSNLHNPSGALLPANTLRTIGEMAQRAGAHVLVDEVYLEMLFGRSAPFSFSVGKSLAADADNPFIVTSSLTKAYGLSGLRCGWILASSELAKRMWLLNDLYGAVAPHAAERMSVIAFDHLEQFRKRARALLETNRALLDAFLDSRRDLECFRPVAGTVAFPRLLRGDPEAFFKLLREKYETTVVPGALFEVPQHFRIGIGGDTLTLRAGLERLSDALDEFNKR